MAKINPDIGAFDSASEKPRGRCAQDDNLEEGFVPARAKSRSFDSGAQKKRASAQDDNSLRRFFKEMLYQVPSTKYQVPSANGSLSPELTAQSPQPAGRNWLTAENREPTAFYAGMNPHAEIHCAHRMGQRAHGDEVHSGFGVGADVLQGDAA